ncbi:MAG TPA: 4-hydroxythreonine-4-phosphate dehydrogenase PdxA [Candidatus Methylacidiphilales bacterium]|jgi:4-hydroxythreonine-4-phosphate dehydrogenase|nr:4-hydroxythreonine-4-phosphate dehydrogenase PdxA [Candidatus Methylacidiphilales bacterium]
MTRTFPIIAITAGDPAGIGPEVVAKTLRDPRLPKGFRFEVLGEKSGRGIHPGKLSRIAARSALKALEEAARGCLEGRFAAMVTGPVHKLAISRLRPGFIGQTEFLARACGLPDSAAVMVLSDPKLTVALCSNHCSLKEALGRLTPERVVDVAKIMHLFLRRRGIRKPRLAIAGINPHMGENGLFGDEDQRIVLPACRKLREQKIIVCHLPADTVFYYAVRRKAFDAVVCAYHDQGLIPFKQVAFETGVNVTLGLPIIRTSPDHGTALEIAGQGKADHRSMLAAVRLACRLVEAKRMEPE